MNLPKRMSVRDSADAIRRQWLTTLCVADVSFGGINMFFKAESPGQQLLRSIFPIPVWGAALVAAGALIWFGWSVQGGIAGAFVWGFSSGATVATIVFGTAPSVSGPIPAAFLCLCHAMIIYQVGSGMDQDRERRQRQ